MPITPFLNGERFDLEDKRVLGVAFEMVCIALRIGDSDDGVKQAITNKIIDLAKAGERNAISGRRPAWKIIVIIGQLCDRAVLHVQDAQPVFLLAPHAIHNALSVG